MLSRRLSCGSNFDAGSNFETTPTLIRPQSSRSYGFVSQITRERRPGTGIQYNKYPAGMAELADAADSKSHKRASQRTRRITPRSFCWFFRSYCSRLRARKPAHLFLSWALFGHRKGSHLGRLALDTALLRLPKHRFRVCCAVRREAFGRAQAPEWTNCSFDSPAISTGIKIIVL